MADVLVRNLDDKVVKQLKKRAKQYGRSLQAEMKSIIEESVPDYETAWKQVRKFQKNLKRSGKTFSDSTDLIREGRER